MRISLSCALLVACGPIYPQQASNQQPPPPPQMSRSSGPPGMSEPSDPYQAQAEVAQPAPLPMQPTPMPRQPMQAPPPARPPAQPPLSSDTQALVDAHNAARARHCAAPLTWSPVLAQAALRWANSLRDHDCAFEHTPNNQYGENLAGGTAGYLDPTGVVTMWYGEVAKYDFKTGGFSMDTGHFTQVVWRGTTQLGCARSTCKAQNQDLWVCEYDPPGNWEGQYRENVLPTNCR